MTAQSLRQRLPMLQNHLAIIKSLVGSGILATEIQLKKKYAQPVSHTYGEAGKYDVRLSIKDAEGCIDTVSLPGQAWIKELKADWTATEKACLGFPVSFKNTSVGEFTSVTWSLGDGFVDKTNNEGSHIYKDTGHYDLKLVIKDEKGCTDSLVRKQHVQIANPIASFSVKDSISFCPPFDVAFTNTSEFFGKVEWKIGDETSNELNHRKLFTQPGKYEVGLEWKARITTVFVPLQKQLR